ncbi:MAG: hypothetical protein D6683_12565, partial [Actinomyces sp.]
PDRLETLVGAHLARPTDADALVVFHATFTDDRFAERLTGLTPLPLVSWAPPEPRTGGRLRLNALCGANLAAHLLRRLDRPVHLCRADPRDATAPGALVDALAHPLVGAPRPAEPASGLSHPLPGDAVARPQPGAGLDEVHWPLMDRTRRCRVEAALVRHARRLVGAVGDPPDGFGPCRHEPATTGGALDEVPVEVWFDAADRVPTEAADEVVRALRAGVSLPADPGDLEPVARLEAGLADLAHRRRWDAVALRCWPETFTGRGAAPCAAVARLTDAGLPVACESDTAGAATMALLADLAGSPAGLFDLVDVDPGDDTVAVWHCGALPPSLAARPVAGRRHPNRGVPLVVDGRLAPGRVTVARLSTSRGLRRLVVGGGEVLDRPAPYRGGCGVVRPDRGARAVLETTFGEGLEHHLALVRGDVRDELRAVAAELGLGLVAW